MKKRMCCALLAAALAALAGCRAAPEPLEVTTFAMVTVISYTIYDKDRTRAREVQDRMTDQLNQLEGLLSVTGGDSDI